MPSAPLGGRLREADTRPCLVVSPVFVAWRQKTSGVPAILVWRRGRHANVPRPASFRTGGARSRGQFRRAIAPDRGHFGRGPPPKKAKALGTHYVTPTPQSQLIEVAPVVRTESPLG
jgi:hypothetical protein